MNSSQIEKRRYKRIVFNKNHEIEGMFFLSASQPDQQIQARLLNLSEGGLHFIRKRQNKGEIREGDRLTLTSVKGPAPLNLRCEIEMEIRWILDHEFMEHIGYGCEFLNLSNGLRERFRNVVADCILGKRS